MILVRYGEIGTKSKQTRNRIEAQLVKNIAAGIGHKRIKREFGRIFVESNSHKDAEKIARIFGVVSTSAAVKISSELGEIISKGTEYAKARIPQNSAFAVNARRTGKHDYTSRDIAVKLGAEIVKVTGAKVNLKEPDKKIYVEVRNRDAYIFDEIINGVGGMPLGTQGKAVALISGGIDSPVAAWLMMKRGVDIVAVFMDLKPLVDERTINRAMKTIETLAEWKNSKIKTYIVPYGDALLKLLKVEEHKLGCVLCKRVMYRVASLVCEKEKAKAIITGESLGQVASQTIDNLFVIDAAVSIPVFRPLIGMDKNEIIELAKKIGTYEVSTLPANCCIGPPLYPETHATLEKVEKAEASLPIENLAEEIFKKSKIEYVE